MTREEITQEIFNVVPGFNQAAWKECEKCDELDKAAERLRQLTTGAEERREP